MLLFIYLLSVIPVFSSPADSLSFTDNNQAINIVQPDSVLFKEFKDDPQYDYYTHSIKDKRTFWDYILEAISRWLSKNMQIEPEQKSIDNTFLIIGIILIIGLLVLLYIYRPSLFYKNSKRKQDYLVEEDNIYGTNFDKLIAEALSSEEYNQALRWKYLQTLRILQDRELIDWKPNKTVNEYAYELKNLAVRNLFREMSLFFLYFHYGNFKADATHFREVSRLSDEIVKMTGL